MAGLKRFSINVENKLNELYYKNYVTIERWELLAWFGVEKITKTVWNAMLSDWNEWFDEGEAPAINIIRCDDLSATQKYVLIRSDYIKELSEFAE